MGQKAHPYGLRVGYIYTWKSRWFARNKKFPELLIEDVKIRNFIKKKLSSAAVSKVEIERASDKLKILVYSARPGIIIGRRGTEIERLKEELYSLTEKEAQIEIKEIKNISLEAQLVAENIAFQIEKRIPHRRAMKKAIQSVFNAGGKGVKIICAGRLAGAEIARSESYRVGKIPSQTLRADVDYGFWEALTQYGKIGVKVWIFKGDKVLDAAEAEEGEEKRGTKRH